MTDDNEKRQTDKHTANAIRKAAHIVWLLKHVQLHLLSLFCFLFQLIVSDSHSRLVDQHQQHALVLTGHQYLGTLHQYRHIHGTGQRI